MIRYVFIETRDPFESRDVQFVAETAVSLRQSGNDVILFLVQNGVFAVRKNARGSHLPGLARAGVTLLADDFSLRERGIEASELGNDIRESNIDLLVDLLAQEDTKAIWH